MRRSAVLSVRSSRLAAARSPTAADAGTSSAPEPSRAFAHCSAVVLAQELAPPFRPASTGRKFPPPATELPLHLDSTTEPTWRSPGNFEGRTSHTRYARPT